MQTIWITGGSTGIGFATAKKFLNEKWRVIISSRNNTRLEKAKIQLLEKSINKELHIVKCDVSNQVEVDNTINFIEKKVAPIDLALLNAAAYSPNNKQEFDINNYELLLNVNLKGTLYCINTLKNYMAGRKGHISIVSSPIGYRGWPTSGAYGMTKAAQLNIAESLYFDFKKLNIRISVINPGFIDTESTRKNTFKMPFLKSADYAADKIYDGLIKKEKFEIFFPLIVVLFIKIMRILPYRLYFYVWKKIGNF